MSERELTLYLPQVVQNIEEYRKITTAQQPEIDTLWMNVRSVREDQFIHDATENGVSRWEVLLGISPKATETLDERKFTILTKINSQLPYTYRMLQEQLENLCGKENVSLELNHLAYTLVVRIGLVAGSNFEDVRDLLKQVVPANIMIDLSLKYNRHEMLHPYKHAELAPYTHEELRNEVF